MNDVSEKKSFSIWRENPNVDDNLRMEENKALANK